MAGAKDIIQGYGVGGAVAHMDALLGRIFADRPSAVILLGSLWWVPTPNFYNYDVSQIQAVNNQLPGLVAKYTQQGRVIQLVDQYNLVWALSDFNVDRIHPNATGYAKMAQAWRGPLASHLAVTTTSLSPDGSIIAGGTGSLTASSGVWTFGTPSSSGNWYILLNGASAGGGAGQKIEVANGGQSYALGTDNNWYLWGGATWVLGNPSGVVGSVSPDGSLISSGAGSLIASSGTWSFGAQDLPNGWRILLNGNHAGGGVGSKITIANGGKVYALGTDGNWYLWTGEWVSSSPSVNNNTSPDGTAITGGVGSLVIGSDMWKFGAARDGGNWDLLLNGTSVGIGSELEVSQGGKMFGVGTDGTWYRWTGSTWTHGSP